MKFFWNLRLLLRTDSPHYHTIKQFYDDFKQQKGGRRADYSNDLNALGLIEMLRPCLKMLLCRGDEPVEEAPTHFQCNHRHCGADQGLFLLRGQSWASLYWLQEGHRKLDFQVYSDFIWDI